MIRERSRRCDRGRNPRRPLFHGHEMGRRGE